MQAQYSRVLIVGNGFDLAHGMPTKYTDFLYFATKILWRFYWQKNYNGMVYSKDINRPYDMDVIKDINQHTVNKIVDAVINDYQSDIEKELDIKNHLKNWLYNDWLRYFLYIFARNKTEDKLCDGTWIDFEKEIRNLVNKISNTRWKLNFSTNWYEIHMPQLGDNISLKIFKVDYENRSGQADDIYNLVLINMYDQLQQFDKLLAYYLKLVDMKYSFGESNKIFKNITIFSEKDDRRIPISNVLSFNYTRNAARYIDTNTQSNRCHYINGSLEQKNIILGYDDNVLPGDSNEGCYRFLKTVQRVEKDIVQRYREWFVPSEEKTKKIEAVFIGHSLDETDKDILLNIINSVDSVVVTYYNLKDRIDKIKRLYFLLGNSRFHDCVNNPEGKPIIKIVDSRIFM